MAEHKQIRIPQRISVALFAMLTSLTGCATDQSLAPPANSEQVTVRIKVPPELKAETVEVMYRSTLCTFTDHGAYGDPYQRDGYQNMDIQPVQQGQSDIYEAKVPRDGGGACQWKLSNVTFGVTYREPDRFGENVVFGAGGGVVVMFDDRRPSRSFGLSIHVDGNLTIKENYYPWIDEEFIGSYRKSVNLTGSRNIHLMYKASTARLVYFEPALHSKYIVYSAGPRVKKKGAFTKFTYPDGSILENGDYEPRFQKLEAIRLAAEKK
ncbi:hypothetical protein N7414_17900 [Pseudomonas sp. GD04087]|uniref:hypothetical protein n=1 Tax=unclassified Pseudomonas TaxID=196821 RepID=UPI0024480F06|nr:MULTISPECIES: hypothetical protein [unclassified Pseudomonas]MDH0290999.1 hypothetical protein [Pseudomonas sp. GD04087]MDH1050251.1 hypothetical protein [Pseudomonas sp. GD03903]MDH1998733.1 hypothetical protein [Pseudomonas sp. GD03691]